MDRLERLDRQDKTEERSRAPVNQNTVVTFNACDQITQGRLEHYLCPRATDRDLFKVLNLKMSFLFSDSFYLSTICKSVTYYTNTLSFTVIIK